MKAASLLRNFWAACLVCGVLVAASGMAYATVANNGTKCKTETSVQQQEISQQQDDPTAKKKLDASPAVGKENPAKAVENKAEVKKESPSSQASFSFLYYLFYKGNFAENTNNAIRSSLSTLMQRILE